MDLMLWIALITGGAVGAAIGAVITVLACAAGRTTAYLEGYRLGMEDGKLEAGKHEPNAD
jgi:hypothetical protein